MKAKSLHCSKNGLAQPIAEALGGKFKCVSDKMPPAYPNDGDKIVFIGVEMTGKAPQPVEQYCKDINPSRVKYLAFYVINGTGDTSGLDHVISLAKANGVEIAGTPLGITVKSSLFKKGSVTEADINKTVEWAEQIANSI